MPGIPLISAVKDLEDPDLEQLKKKNLCESSILRCSVLAHKGDYEGAVLELQEALKLFPNSARGERRLGLFDRRGGVGGGRGGVV